MIPPEVLVVYDEVFEHGVRGQDKTKRNDDLKTLMHVSMTMVDISLYTPSSCVDRVGPR